MKKIAYLSVIISFLITPLNAVEKMNCSELKKFSKAYLSCKSGNFKAGIINTGTKIKKNTINKIKKTETVTNENSPAKEKTINASKISTAKDKISKVTKEKTAGFKNRLNKMFSGNTKQYPKGTK